MRIYFDHNASAPLRPAARAAIADLLGAEEALGNPSSLHGEGRRARARLEAARDEVAALVGGAAEEVVFTSGGTEADQLAIVGAAEAARAAAPGRTRVLASAVEHPAVDGALGLLAARGFAAERLPVDREGRVDLDALAARLGADVALVCLQLANHELGTLQPVAEAARLAAAGGAWVHADAVQAAGKVPLDAAALGVDLLALSAHKIGGPPGVGALWVRRGRVPQALFAGHQERGRRPGSENLSGAVGFAAAAREVRLGLDEEAARVAALRDRLEAGLLALGARRHGGGARVGNTTNVAFPGVPGDLLVESLDLEGVAVSTGAACTSGSRAPSPVLLACGLSPVEAREAVRFSLGPGNTAAEVDAVLAMLPALLARIRAAI